MRLTATLECKRPQKVRWSFTIWSADQWVCITCEADPAVHDLQPGEHELSCTLPRLTLMPGRYQVCVAILDAETGFPLIGRNGPEPALEIDIGAADSSQVARAQSNQFVTVDVEWSGASKI